MFLRNCWYAAAASHELGDGLLARMSDDDWNSVLQTNLTSCFYWTKAIGWPMCRNRFGRIINIGSISAQTPRTNSAPYAATKMAIEGLTRSLTLDGRPFNIVSSIIPEGRVSHFRGDADEVWANVLIPDTIMNYQDDDSDYGGMIMCSNSEIGTGPVYQAPSTFRSICLNGCIWGQTTGQKSRWVHRGAVDYLELHKAIHENINSQIPLLVPYITAMQEAKKLLFDSTRFVQIVGVIAKENGLSKPQAVEIVKQFNAYESDQRNAFGVLNAVTRAGQFFDARTCIKFDGIGGDIVNPKNWNAYLTKAKVFSEKDMLAVFGNGLAV